MMNWKGAVSAMIVGTGAICAGCGIGTEEFEQETTVASTPAEGVEFATARFSVDGMTCGGCVLATEMAVKRVVGVRSVTASLGEDGGPGNATVEYDVGRADTAAIAAAIRRAGFTPRLEEGPLGDPQG